MGYRFELGDLNKALLTLDPAQTGWYLVFCYVLYVHGHCEDLPDSEDDVDGACGSTGTKTGVVQEGLQRYHIFSFFFLLFFNRVSCSAALFSRLSPPSLQELMIAATSGHRGKPGPVLPCVPSWSLCLFLDDYADCFSRGRRIFFSVVGTMRLCPVEM